MEKIFNLYIFDPTVDFNDYFAMCKKLGMNSVIANPYIYDADGFLDKAQWSGLPLGLNFPVFANETFLAENNASYAVTSQGAKASFDWLHYVCPSTPNYLSEVKKNIEQYLSKINPVYFSLDFIRFFVFWEKVRQNMTLLDIEDGCYCERCINNLEKSSSGTIESRNAAWIKENLATELAAYRCDLIDQTVKEIVEVVKSFNPDITILMKVVPWKESDFDGAIHSIAGQRMHTLKEHIDMFVPMTYNAMLDRSPQWIKEVLDEYKAITGKPVISSIQTDKTYDEPPISDAHFEEIMRHGIDHMTGGAFIFRYGSLIENPARVEVIADYLSSRKI